MKEKGYRIACKTIRQFLTEIGAEHMEIESSDVVWREFTSMLIKIDYFWEDTGELTLYQRENIIKSRLSKAGLTVRCTLEEVNSIGDDTHYRLFITL